MEYTTIEPSEAVDQLMGQRALEHRVQEFAQQLDASALGWCADIASLTDSGDAGAAARDQAANAESQAVASAAVAEKFVERIEGKGAADSVDASLLEHKKNWLPQYIAQVEAEHAQHAALADMAEADGNAEQAEVHRLAMLRCEAAQVVAIQELKSLG